MIRTQMGGGLVCVAIALLALGCARQSDPPLGEGSTGGEATAPLAETAAPMTLDRMDSVLRSIAPSVEREGGAWVFEYLDTPVLVVTDETANRMRVLTPVTEASQVTQDQWAAVLVANFHTALDARYAVSGDVVYSVFLHPLRSLTEADLRSAVSQVVVLSKTFGSTYNSSGVAFGAEPSAEPTTTPGVSAPL
ncbi:MAG: hypothetical protein AAF500_16520 [Myxococcota bacterium]